MNIGCWFATPAPEVRSIRSMVVIAYRMFWYSSSRSPDSRNPEFWERNTDRVAPMTAESTTREIISSIRVKPARRSAIRALTAGSRSWSCAPAW